MTPEAIVAMVTALAEATAEVAKLYQTPAGQKALEQQIAAQQDWMNFWRPIGEGITKLAQGKDLLG
jgi:hypothetical protein